MLEATVTSTGQVTIPKRIRQRLGVAPGDRLEFVEEGGVMPLRKKVETSPFNKYRGILTRLKGSDPDRLVEEMRGRWL
jgi:antitoxin PrlF